MEMKTLAQSDAPDALLHAFSDVVQAMFGVVDIQGKDVRFLYNNASFARFIGLPVEEISGRLSSDIGFRADITELWIERYRECERTGHTIRFTYPHDVRGEDRWLSLVVGPMAPSPDGTPRFYYVAEDVTEQMQAAEETRRLKAELQHRVVRHAAALRVEVEERRRAEAALRESEERFRQLADSMPQLVWTAEPDGTVDYYNLRVKEFEGFRLENGCWTWEPGLHPDDIQPTVDAWAEALRTGTMYEIGHRVRRADGTYRWFLSRGTPLRGPQGRIVKWFGTATDIHKQKMAEEALRISEEQYRLINRATHDVLWDWNLRTNYLAWNDSIRTVFGYGPQDVSTDVAWWHDHIHPGDRERVLAGIQYVVDQGGEGWSDSYRFRKHDGTYSTVLDRGYVSYDGGLPVRMIGSMVDITEQEKAREALRAADQAKDEFLAMLAHELRNPLGAISNAVALLRMRDDDVLNGANHQMPLDVLDRQVRHMTRQVEDLLDVSRITRGKLDLRLERTDLVLITRRATDAIRSACDEGGHTLVVMLPDEPMWLEGDPGRLEQALTNLLNNACKYTQEGGRVEVSVQRNGGEVVVAVRDNGIGIGPDMLPRIFDLFTQEDRTLDRSRGGLGIGLTLVKQLVEMHGGAVDVHSDGPGHGSRFSIRLPLMDRGGLVEAPESHRDAAASEALDVLLVEDNADAAEALAGILELWGHRVRVAPDGPSALEAVREARPDVVLLDIGLPGMDGYEVARRMRALHPEAGMVLVALTGYGREDDRNRAREAGFDHHLVKPAQMEALAGVLSRSNSSHDPRGFL